MIYYKNINAYFSELDNEGQRNDAECCETVKPGAHILI